MYPLLRCDVAWVGLLGANVLPGVVVLKGVAAAASAAAAASRCLDHELANTDAHAGASTPSSHVAV